MGPVIILDKSTFQALSGREMTRLRGYFLENLTPILPRELIGDLAKRVKNDKAPERVVAELASKFGGSGPAVNTDYRSACLANLDGYEIQMVGSIVVDYARSSTAPDGSRGVLIDLHPINRAIMRWSRGEFTDLERDISAEWREATRNLSYQEFLGQLDGRRVIAPRAASLDELPSVVDGLVNSSGLQDVWVEWLLRQLGPLPSVGLRILDRWRRRDTILLRDHAPYAHHCMRTLLALHVAVRSKLVRWDSTNLVDVQYLYYMPFCMVFASHDKLHKALAPMLLRGDQSFADGDALKSDLIRLGEHWEGLDDRTGRRRSFALGGHPVPARGSIVSELWQKHCGPWSPERHSWTIPDSMTDDECREAIREVEDLFRAVGGD